MQPAGTPFTPHCTIPLVIRGSRLAAPKLLGSKGIGTGAPGCDNLGSIRIPVTGSTAIWCASAELNSDATQL